MSEQKRRAALERGQIEVYQGFEHLYPDCEFSFKNLYKDLEKHLHDTLTFSLDTASNRRLWNTYQHYRSKDLEDLYIFICKRKCYGCNSYLIIYEKCLCCGAIQEFEKVFSEMKKRLVERNDSLGDEQLQNTLSKYNNFIESTMKCKHSRYPKLMRRCERYNLVLKLMQDLVRICDDFGI